MATWTTITDTALEPGKPIRSVDGLALRDNVTALAEGAAGAPSLGPGIAANGAAGAVGTYALLLRRSDNASISIGSTYAGSGLRYSGFNAVVGARGILSGGVGGAPAGSWRAMGHASSASNTYPATVFLRIS